MTPFDDRHYEIRRQLILYIVNIYNFNHTLRWEVK